jgi:hypothetical protein
VIYAASPRRKTLTQLGSVLVLLLLSLSTALIGFACGVARWDRERARYERRLSECADLTASLREERSEYADGWDHCTARLLEKRDSVLGCPTCRVTTK